MRGMGIGKPSVRPSIPIHLILLVYNIDDAICVKRSMRNPMPRSQETQDSKHRAL
jgi:hypothetical protein